MTRLPIAGQDDGVWGNVLNDFLGVEHNTDGSLKQSGSLATKAPATRQIVSGTGLSGGGDLTTDRTLNVTSDTTTQRMRVSKAGTLTGTRQELNLIEGTNITITEADNVGSNRVDVTINATTQTTSDATTSSKGIVQLAGDLSGTAAIPSLINTGPGVTSSGDATHSPLVSIDSKGRVTALTSQAILLPESAVTNLTSDLGLKAPLASPTFTGITTVSGSSLALSSTTPVHVT